MEIKADVKCVYWSHGRYDSDQQDKVWEEVVPGFFNEKGNMLMGIECAGGYTDAERDNKMEKIKQDSFALSSYIKFAPYIGPEDIVAYIPTFIGDVLRSRGTGAMLSRQNLLLCKWNREHPEKRILPFTESYPDGRTKERISRTCDEFAAAVSISNGKDVYWRDFVAAYRKDLDRKGYEDFIAERNRNWVRMIEEAVNRARADVRTKILVTLGSDHRDLTNMLAAELGEKIRIHDDMVIENPFYGDDWSEKEDEDLLRKIYSKILVHQMIYNAEQKPQGFYRVNSDFIRTVRDGVKQMPVEMICRRMGISDVPTGAGGETVISKKPSDELALEDMEREIHNVPVLEDRSMHPNNIFIYRNQLLYSLANTLGIDDEKDPVFKLLRQILDSVLESAVMEAAGEIYRHGMGDESPCKYVSFIVMKMAKQDPSKPTLWSANKANLAAGKKLVSLAKQCLGR